MLPSRRQRVITRLYSCTAAQNLHWPAFGDYSESQDEGLTSPGTFPPRCPQPINDVMIPNLGISAVNDGDDRKLRTLRRTMIVYHMIKPRETVEF